MVRMSTTVVLSAAATLAAALVVVVLMVMPGNSAAQTTDLGNVTLAVPLTLNLANCPDIYNPNRDPYRGRFLVQYDAGTSGDSYTYSNELFGENQGDGNWTVELILPIDGGTLGTYDVTSICQFLDANGEWIDLVVQPTVSLIPLPAPPGTEAPDPDAPDPGAAVGEAADGSLRPSFTG